MEVLIRIVSRVSPDPYKDCKLTKAGDVIAIKPDGWAWGLDEQVNPNWRIIRLPNLTQAQADSLIAPEPGNASNKMLRIRGNMFDISQLPGAMQSILLAPRTEPVTVTWNVGTQQISSVIRVKPPLADPGG